MDLLKRLRIVALVCALAPGLAVALTLDKDADGVPNDQDDCPYTSAGAKVDRTGCALDEDFDGVADGLDRCPSSNLGTSVDLEGCAKGQVAAGQASPPSAPIAPPVPTAESGPPPAPPSAEGVDPFSVRDAAAPTPEPAPVAAPEILAEPAAPEPAPLSEPPAPVAMPEPVAPAPEPAPDYPEIVFPAPAPLPPLPPAVAEALAAGTGTAVLKVPKLRPGAEPVPVTPAPEAVVEMTPEPAAPPPPAPEPAAPTRSVVTEPIFYGGRRITVATLVPRANTPAPVMDAPIAAPAVTTVVASGPWTLTPAKSSELSAANQSALNDIAAAALRSEGRYEIAGPEAPAALVRSYLVAQGVASDRLSINASTVKTGSVEIRAASN